MLEGRCAKKAPQRSDTKNRELLEGTEKKWQMIWIFYKEQAKKESMWPNLEARLCPFLKDWPNPTATGHPKKKNSGKETCVGKNVWSLNSYWKIPILKMWYGQLNNRCKELTLLNGILRKKRRDKTNSQKEQEVKKLHCFFLTLVSNWMFSIDKDALAIWKELQLNSQTAQFFSKNVIQKRIKNW